MRGPGGVRSFVLEVCLHRVLVDHARHARHQQAVGALLQAPEADDWEAGLAHGDPGAPVVQREVEREPRALERQLRAHGELNGVLGAASMRPLQTRGLARRMHGEFHRQRIGGAIDLMRLPARGGFVVKRPERPLLAENLPLCSQVIEAAKHDSATARREERHREPLVVEEGELAMCRGKLPHRVLTRGRHAAHRLQVGQQRRLGFDMDVGLLHRGQKTCERAAPRVRLGHHSLSRLRQQRWVACVARGHVLEANLRQLLRPQERI